MSALLLSKRYATCRSQINHLFIKAIHCEYRVFRAIFYLVRPLRYAKNCIGYPMKLFTFFLLFFREPTGAL